MLYHGTTIKNLEVILKSGIKPRSTKRKGNWKDYPSRTDMVYLTKAYAFYFAICAADDKDSIVVFEIDEKKLDQSKFYPDEDFVEQVMRRNHVGNKLSPDFHDEVKRNILNYGFAWLQSLNALGNCCYQGTIPVKAITRYCIYDMSRGMLNMAFMDPSISIMNYLICGKKYENLIAWMFGDKPLLPSVEESTNLINQLGTAEQQDKFKEAMETNIKIWTKESNNRKGITVESL